MKKISTEEALEKLRESRTESEIDLVSEVRNMLCMSGLSALVAENYDNNQYIVDARNKKPEMQRFYLNRYWSFQLISAPESSIEERYCLIPNGDVKAWLKLFRDKILPFLVRNHLPRKV